MKRYYVHVYETYRSKFEVEADSMEEACEIAVSNPPELLDRQPAEEITGFHVDVVGDTDYVQSKSFDADCKLIDQPGDIPESTLAKLAKFALYTLTNDEEWDSSTLEAIAYEATKLGLAKNDEEGMFVGGTPEAIECRRLQLQDA